ncbi:WD40 repeat-like protein [Rhizoctonia solani]|uniref:WD40 repeat-like protein n=1 Tax=Rhizoctonia solani TaxID=456999 RepID=A0A8H7M0L5_9AGAM|nr:WD40 repeat-like protein [Rhizoctonia solani]
MKVGQLRHWITDVEVSPGNTNPECKFGARLFVDDELVCDLPWIDHTRPLRWSGLLPCNVTPQSELLLKLCRSVKDSPRYFIFPSFSPSGVNEETGESILDIRDAVWAVNVKSLTPAMTIPEYNNAKVSFLICMKTWELLDQQIQLDHTIKGILHGLYHIKDIVDTVSRTAGSALEITMNTSKEHIDSILTLLEDISLFIFSRLAVNDFKHASVNEEDHDDVYSLEFYLDRLKESQTAFHKSWIPVQCSDEDTNNQAHYEQPEVSDEAIHTTHSSETNTPDPYEILSLLRPTDPSGYDPDQAYLDGTREGILDALIEWTQTRHTSQSLMWISGQRLHDTQTLAGSFFCRLDDPDSSNPLQLFNNLIYSIANRFSPYAQEVAKAIRADRGLCTSHLVSWLKVIVTARPVGPIQEYFEISCPHKRVMHLQDYDASPDIRAYIEDGLGSVARQERWPENTIDKLCRALSAANGSNEDEVKEAFLRCVGAIIAISEHKPLAMPTCIKSLGPLLHTKDDNRIRFYHPSFKDFITTPSRSGPFCIQLSQYDAEPTVCCLRIMHRDLRFNICGLETSHLLNSEIPDLQDRIEAYISPALKYACTHWIDHFIASPDERALNEIKKLLDGPQMMYWIEAMSLLGCVNEAIAGCSKLMSLELARFNTYRQVVLWIRDIHRFLLSFYDAISTSTPHIYVSALAFAPSGSLTAQRMRPHFPNTLSVSQTKDSPWHPCVRSTFYPQPVQCLSISPDGSMAITGHPDGSLHMRDALVGTPIGSPLVGHTSPVTCVAHSPSSHLAASGSHDATVRIWDLKDQSRVESHALTGHSGSVNSVSFCCSINVLASGSSDRTIRLWDTNCMLITGHSDSITCVAVSPDGTKIASGSIDKTVRLWNTLDGKDIGYARPRVKHHASISCIRFSPCSKRIASSSLDGVIQLYYAGPMSPMANTFQHANSVNAVELSSNGLYVISGSSNMTTPFSPNGTLIAFGCGGGDVYVFEAAGWKVPATLASGYNDGSIALWNVATRSCSNVLLSGHTNWVRSVAFSPCGTQLASGSNDETVRLWNVKTGDMIRELKGHTHFVTSVAFSHNGLYIASGSCDKTVRVWNAKTGELIGQPFAEHSDYVTAVSFLPNNNYLISGSDNKTIRVRTLGRGNASIERPNHTKHGFPWPTNPYDLSSHTQYRGWVTRDQHSLAFWLPPYDQEPGQFLSRSADDPYPQTFIDYSNFVRGTEWTNVASEAIRSRPD